MKKILITLLVLALLFFVGFKFLMKQKDLGITADKALVASFESKYGVKNESGKINLDVNLDSNDITSIFSVWEERDRNFPLSNVQIKFNPDGTGEASGILKVDTAISLAKSLGYSDADIDKAKSYIKYVKGDLPFYVKGSGGMSDNVLSIDPSVFKIANVTVPESITNLASVAVEDMVKKRIDQIGGADIKEANFQSGSLHLVGTVPDTIKY